MTPPVRGVLVPFHYFVDMLLHHGQDLPNGWRPHPLHDGYRRIDVDTEHLILPTPHLLTAKPTPFVTSSSTPPLYTSHKSTIPFYDIPILSSPTLPTLRFRPNADKKGKLVSWFKVRK